MPTHSHTNVAVALPGAYVPPNLIQQIEEALAALYGLIEAAIRLMEDEVPDGPERRIICSGLVTWFFKLYHALNNARVLFYVSFDPARQSNQGPYA